MTTTCLYLREDTIAAPSTPPGKGAVAVIRVSGPDAIALCERIFRSHGPRLSAHPRRMIYGTLEDPATREPVDNGLCVAFPAPRSYTGENMAEIHTHGSEAVVRQLLEILYREGARPAEPGEFTFRAVRNGKMDLAQAEGVATLIESRTRLARAMSLRVLEGAFSRDLARIKDSVVSALVEIETQIEFPGE
ncbi:MAG TPA: tRNA uridine-5-carboxymethylaminomethyl(34) synthesis GTPase MnmE, partial [bacterium]|nr:tRNA uridine-5-carboxymethylaminomethyl(34) synthesis GTPase MnmE [bacterium]